jgi:preprotein translocase subunit YajC
MHRIILLITAAASLFAESGGPAGPAPVDAPAGGAPTTPTHAAGAEQGSPYGMLIMMVGFIAIFYFFMIRPQQKAEKARKALIAATKTGQKIVTIGGLHGEVIAVGESTVDIRVGASDKESVVMTFNKAAIATNLTAEAEAKKV